MMVSFTHALPLAASLFLSGASAAPAPAASSAATTDAKYLLVFGDSYSTTGSWPGGDKPSVENPLGNPALPGTTTSGGLNWVGQVTSKLNTSLTFTYDFAVSGATTDKDIVDSYASACVDDQVDQFNQYLDGKPPGDDSLVVFWTGINDIGESFWDSTDVPQAKVMDRYFELLSNLFEAGLKKFVLFNVPPFDKAPAFNQQGETKLTKLRADIKSYNEALETRFAAFKTAHSGAQGQVFNVTPTFNKVINDPTSYGATDATCQSGDGTSCVWTDTYHPGLKVHELLGKAFIEAIGDLW
ncbi:carbohydrate esterase family 16 protein [Aplosporella prunicola CBS 121167]|uniref:Carbohydrate esterase family 16 protein n=1 Tax=Aplosporella prunicola CBS 121167 TaxID=1176127 RepID=A0A6A6BUK0_9PEZI|nr:carbohydrate esterase family 16 protein [Aplosporella prunicola CBS 121167]KAF2147023.1 carbohydrate esterase family 16 protein [Aplosporella prunicola CBS 121167]